MATQRDPQTNQSKERRRTRNIEQKRADLADNEQVQRLLSLYEMSLTEAMPAPLFGPDQRFQLAIYDEEHERTLRSVSSSLDYLSQDLGFANQAGYEAIKQLELQDTWKKRLLEGALLAGKSELQKYLRILRPLLMDRQIYFYCTTPGTLVKTLIETGHFLPDKEVKRILCALPMSVEVAELYGCSLERIKELAPQVAWLIPMLVVYRKVKVTDQLLICLDGWQDILTPQQNERMHTAFVRSAPYIVNEQVTQLLLPRWKKHHKR
jgi:hypothetical protein